jgi:hypothetical protein
MANELQKSPGLEVATQKGGLGNLLRAIGEDSPEILTGVLGEVVTGVYGPVAGVAATVGVKVLHGALKGQGWRQIAAALQPLKNAGKIKEDFEDSDLGKACLAELLDAIEKNPDPRRIQALKTLSCGSPHNREKQTGKVSCNSNSSISSVPSPAVKSFCWRQCTARVRLETTPALTNG